MHDLVTPVPPVVHHAGNKLHKAHPAMCRVLGVVCPREEGLAVRGHDDRKGPSPAAGHHLTNGHVKVVDVGPLLTVHLDRDEILV